MYSSDQFKVFLGVGQKREEYSKDKKTEKEHFKFSQALDPLEYPNQAFYFLIVQ